MEVIYVLVYIFLKMSVWLCEYGLYRRQV